MSRRRPYAFALVLALAAAACGRHLLPPEVPSAEIEARSQDDAREAFASLAHAFERVLDVSDRLRVANAAECGARVGSDLGWVAWSDDDFDRHFRELAREFLGTSGQPVVVALARDGAAARAGVRLGDRVRRVGSSAVSDRDQIASAEHDLAPDGATVVVEREGAELTVAVVPARACEQRVVLSQHQVINAVAHESNIYVTQRLVDVASDDELAFALAHALAMEIRGVNAASLLREGEFVPEPATTRFAVQLSQRAGFSVAGVERLLELQATEQPNMVMGSHPQKVELGEIPRRVVALRMVRASLAAETQAAH
ncbi:MAG TPA: hypothetical protein VMS55_21290 [Myxococcota bacterium]|nr:hypothetical protein [Myxococcota bacterium]